MTLIVGWHLSNVNCQVLSNLFVHNNLSFFHWFLTQKYLSLWCFLPPDLFTIFSWVHFYFGQVQLNLRLRAFLYNTSDAYYKCTFADGLCSLRVLFPNGNAIVLTSPKTEQVTLCSCYWLALVLIFFHFPPFIIYQLITSTCNLRKLLSKKKKNEKKFNKMNWVSFPVRPLYLTGG